MGLPNIFVIAFVAISASSFGLAKDFSGEDDLVAVESRYKVVAKPEPYKPPRPAPDDYEVTTRRGIDGAEIIYPTTTYRDQYYKTFLPKLWSIL